jgi:hypothetical protein
VLITPPPPPACTDSRKQVECTTAYLLVGFEHVALEDVASAISRDVAEDLEVLRVMRDVEYPEKSKQKTNVSCAVQY